MSNIDKQALRISELEELNELLRDKVKKLESDLWDKEQLRQVYSEKSLDLECKVRELEARTVAVKQFYDFQIVRDGATEDYAKGYIDCQRNYNKAIYAAGIKVKVE